MSNLRMRSTRAIAVAVLVAGGGVSLGGMSTACGGDPPVGSDCQTDKDCGSALKCFCVMGTPGGPNGYVPGKCSVECASKADCAHLGPDMSCAADLCTGVNVCLENYSGPTLP